MAIYAFETITAPQALAITFADTVTVQAGTAADATVVYQAATATAPETVAVTLGGRTVVFGTNVEALSLGGRFSFPDGSRLMFGGPGHDSAAGGAGNDAISGVDGDDSLSGGDGDDRILGGAGADTLQGGAGSDTLQGGDGDDLLMSGAGPDTADGGGGFDTASFSGAIANYVIQRQGGQFAVSYTPDGAGSPSWPATLSNIERLRFSDGDFQVSNLMTIQAVNAVVAEGNSGLTAHSFQVQRVGDVSAAATITWQATTSSGADFQGGGGSASGQISFAAGEATKQFTIYTVADTVDEADESFEVRLVSDSSWTFVDGPATGRATNDDAAAAGGGGGDQRISGGGGPDTIQGTTGNDTISGGNGESYLRGGEGNDVVAGGDDFDDINGNQGDDTASGGLGDDWVVGGKDNDSLTGDGGNDIVYGNLGSDYCSGGDGDDIVRGGQADDTVLGGAGNDWLSGDRGDDTVTGGIGADDFHTFGEAGIDRVTDFNLAEGDQVMLDPGTTYTVSQVGADTVIEMGGGGQMVLVGVSMASLTGGWIFGA